MRELKKFKSKNKYDDENDDQSESSFSGRNNFCCNIKCCHYYFIPRHFEICEERREENRKNQKEKDQETSSYFKVNLKRLVYFSKMHVFQPVE